MSTARVEAEGASAASSGLLSGVYARRRAAGLFARTDAQNVWGCDPSTLRVSIAVAGVDVRTRSFTKAPARSGKRLQIIYAETQTLARELVLEHGRPDAVFVEAPGGKWVEPQMFYAVGCIQAGLAEFCLDVRLVPVATWKKRSVGHGHAKKPEVLAWARRDGYPGSLQDEADAWAIAYAGVRLLEPDAEQLQL